MLPVSRNEIDALRAIYGQIGALLEVMESKLQAPKNAAVLAHRVPTIEECADQRNKVGANLTPRGVELLFRVFDDDGGYNRAAKLFTIAQSAAKNRKAQWVKLGGKSRKRAILDIDEA
jgi:hypothetical protein